MSPSERLPPRRKLVRQKARILSCRGPQVVERVLYLDVHDAEAPKELFLRVKGAGANEEIIALYDITARLASLALQYGAPLEQVGTSLLGSKFAPGGPVRGDARIKTCTSPTDYIGRHVLLYFCGREDLAHVPAPPMGS